MTNENFEASNKLIVNNDKRGFEEIYREYSSQRYT